MDYVLISDLARYYVMVAALLLSALLLRLTYLRMGSIRNLLAPHPDAAHPLAMFALVSLLPLAAVRRFGRLGEPGDAYLWFVFAMLTLAVIGTLLNVRFDLRPPWRR